MCIHFNKQRLAKKLIPNFARVKVPNTSLAHIHTKQKVTTMRIKDEIKYLHYKQQNLNLQIYNLHLQMADTLPKFWSNIQ
jgi:hypothetical protein